MEVKKINFIRLTSIQKHNIILVKKTTRTQKQQVFCGSSKLSGDDGWTMCFELDTLVYEQIPSAKACAPSLSFI
jgi:hypothetical protein